MAKRKRNRKPKGIAIYHVMRPDEDFTVTAKILLKLVADAEAKSPGALRHLFLDIEGHRNAAGGYDNESLELQQEFVIGYLSKWLTSLSVPLLKGLAERQVPQQNDVPPELVVIPRGL